MYKFAFKFTNLENVNFDILSLHYEFNCEFVEFNSSLFGS